MSQFFPWFSYFLDPCFGRNKKEKTNYLQVSIFRIWYSGVFMWTHLIGQLDKSNVKSKSKTMHWLNGGKCGKNYQFTSKYSPDVYPPTTPTPRYFCGLQIWLPQITPHPLPKLELLMDDFNIAEGYHQTRQSDLFILDHGMTLSHFIQMDSL